MDVDAFAASKSSTIDLDSPRTSANNLVLRPISKPLLASSRTDCSSNWKCLVAAELPSALPKCRHRQGFRSAREAGALARIVPHRGFWSLGLWFATQSSWEVIQWRPTCRNSFRSIVLLKKWIEDFSRQTQ